MKKTACCRVNLNNLTTAIFLVTIGVLLLLNNLNYIPWTVWLLIFRFWPMFLIFWGLRIALEGKFISYFLPAIFYLIFMGILVVFSIASDNRNFERQIQKIFPGWKIFKENLPLKPNPDQFYFKNDYGEFKCNLFDNDCQIYMR